MMVVVAGGYVIDRVCVGGVLCVGEWSAYECFPSECIDEPGVWWGCYSRRRTEVYRWGS